MENKDVIIRGIHIGKKELDEINTLVQKHWQQGRTFISKAICQHWEWKQPNGWLKDRACRDMLLTLEKKELIALPPTKQKNKQNKRKPQQQKYLIDTSPCEGSISDYNSLEFSMVRKSSREGLWNYLVATR